MLPPNKKNATATNSLLSPNDISGKRRRLLTTTTAGAGAKATTSPLPLLKRTRFSPDLTICHGCGLRIPSNTNSSRQRLRLLRSQWRVVLLCRTCLSDVADGELCSYCFAVASPSSCGLDCLDCLSCHRRIHLGCAQREHRSVAESALNSGCFVCVDCGIMPNFSGRAHKLRGRICLEDVAKDAQAVVEEKVRTAEIAREVTARKAVAAKIAADRAANVLGVVVGEKKVEDSVVPDEALALQLHLAMNGSRRISRSSKKLMDDNVIRKCAESGCSGTIGKVEMSRQDEQFPDGTGSRVFCKVSCDEVYENGNEEKKNANMKLDKDAPLKEEQGSTSDKVVNSRGDDCSIDSVVVYHRRRQKISKGLVILGNPEMSGERYSSELQERDCNSNPDRYMKKYVKRQPKPKEVADVKNEQLHHCCVS